MKKLLAILLAAMMVFSIVGCTATETPASGTDESSTGTPDTSTEDTGAADGDVIVNFYEHADNDAILKDLVETYNSITEGVTVVYHSIPNDDYDDKIKVLTAGGSESVDGLWIRSPGAMQSYMSNGVFADLSPYAQASGIDLSPIESTLEAVKDGDSFYGYPTTGSAWMLFYNKDLFDAKGLDYPINITWDEYCDLAKELTYEEDGVKYYGGVMPDWNLDLGAAAAGEYLTAPAPMEKTRKYMEILYRMYTGDKSHISIQEMSGGTFDVNATFSSNNVYMMVNGDWTFNLLETDFAYGAAPFPIFEGSEEGATVGQCSYFAVLNSSKVQQETYDFIEWATTSPEGTAIYAKNQGVPCYSTEEALATYKETVKVDGVDYRFSAKISPEGETDEYYGDINDAFTAEMKLYLLDEETLDEAFDNFIPLRDEIVQNNS